MILYKICVYVVVKMMERVFSTPTYLCSVFLYRRGNVVRLLSYVPETNEVIGMCCHVLFCAAMKRLMVVVHRVAGAWVCQSCKYLVKSKHALISWELKLLSWTNSLLDARVHEHTHTHTHTHTRTHTHDLGGIECLASV